MWGEGGGLALLLELLPNISSLFTAGACDSELYNRLVLKMPPLKSATKALTENAVSSHPAAKSDKFRSPT